MKCGVPIRRPAILVVFAAFLLVHGVAVAQRGPVPDESARAAAKRLLDDIYKDQIDAAETPKAKLAVAQKLAETAGDLDDPAQQYVLLIEASKLAVQAAAPETFADCLGVIRRAVDRLGESFNVDPLALRASALWNITKAHSDRKSMGGMVDETLKLVDEATAGDQFDLAERVVKVAAAAAAKSRDRRRIKKVAARKKTLAVARRQFAEVKDALAVLKDSPDDAAANLTVGKYRCLVQGRWDEGLPMLALGNDAALKTAAAAELKQPTDAAGQLAVGDHWWDLAEAQKQSQRQPYQQRAAHWYQRAFPGLTTLKKKLVTARLEKIAAPAPTGRTEERPGKDEIVKGKWIDLLPLLDIEKHNVLGKWARSGSQLAVLSTHFSRVMLPVALNGSYDIELQVMRQSGRGDVTVNLPVGPGACAAMMDSWAGRGGRTYIAGINGKSHYNLPETIRGVFLENGKMHKIEIAVRVTGPTEATISLRRNGQPAFTWQGSPQSLATMKHWIMPNDRCLGLGVFDSNVVFKNVRLRLVSGQAKILELRERIPHIVALWQHHYGTKYRPAALWSTGHLERPEGPSTWQRNDNQLILRWPASTDDVTLSPDGKKYTGTSSTGLDIRGERLD